ncbi:MAG: Ig-like domain-containing protein [Pseudomonadota bacterium]
MLLQLRLLTQQTKFQHSDKARTFVKVKEVTLLKYHAHIRTFMIHSKTTLSSLFLISSMLLSACGGDTAAPTLQSITIAPASSSLPLGMTRQFTATGLYSDGASKDLTTSTTWSSSADTVATISASGLASGFKTGSSTVTATSTGIAGSTTLTTTPAILLNALAWSGTRITAVGLTVGTSSDGTVWTSSASPINDPLTHAALNSIAWNGVRYVAVGLNGGMIPCGPAGNLCSLLIALDYSVILNSADGINWTSTLQSRLSSDVGSGLNGVIWSGTQFVAVGKNGAILSSPDSTNWAMQASGTTNTLNAISWSGTQFAAVGANGTILTSPNGLAWTPQNSGTGNTLNGVTWTGTRFIAVGQHGAILTSPDGTTWTAQASVTDETLNAIAWSATRLVATGENGVILTSSDGATWTPQKSGTRDSIKGIVWADKQFVAGGGGAILTSPDGITWTSRTSL